MYKRQGVNPDTRCKDLTDEEVKKISEVIDASQTVDGDLRREIALNIKRLQEIGCYRGCLLYTSHDEVAKEALRLATHKLPIKCKVVSREDLEGGDNSEN